MDISKYKVDKGPPTIYYIADFISKEDEENILDKIYKAPKPKWTQLANRRLQNYGGLPHPKGMIKEDMPTWLSKCIIDIDKLGVFNGNVPNHVLVNEYTQGQGIMPHLDGKLFYPTITTVSLGSHGVLNFYEPLSDDSKQNDIPNWAKRLKFSIFLERRSLVVLQDECYNTYLHGIDEISNDTIKDYANSAELNCKLTIGEVVERGTRVSLTIRYVPKTTKTGIRIGR